MAELRGATFRNLHTGRIYRLADRIMPTGRAIRSLSRSGSTCTNRVTATSETAT
ncbi:MAG: hypothetical protein HC828_09430 [Blastochloris sp.]|nr:hypothetical protein [Blastochloris sp.]